MAEIKSPTPEFEFHPLTPERWPDLEQLFGPNGAYGGCWCMWWRITRKQFEQQAGEGNRQAMRELVASGEVPGILAYSVIVEPDEEPLEQAVGWCSVAPRSSFGSLNRSPVLKKIDDTPVWSIVCFYIDKSQRGKGLTLALIQAAVEYVRSQGGKVLEAYPTVVREKRLPPVSSFMGLPTVFEQAGFIEIARPSRSKVIMRYTID
jgi:GNAT superfamily N-acetyltransferase